MIMFVADGEEDPAKRKANIKQAVSLLPSNHRSTLEFVFKYLNEVRCLSALSHLTFVLIPALLVEQILRENVHDSEKPCDCLRSKYFAGRERDSASPYQYFPVKITCVKFFFSTILNHFALR